jgi:hypothetical protein
VERVNKIRYEWGADGPSGWQLTIGYAEPKDPALKAFQMIQQINTVTGELGIF